MPDTFNESDSSPDHVLLPNRPDPFDSIVGYQLDLPWAEYSHGPPRPKYLGTIYWSWTRWNERLDKYYLHRARRHWILWIRERDEWERLRSWTPVAYVLRRQASREEAAIHLVVDFLRYLRNDSAIELFHTVVQDGLCDLKTWYAIGAAVWPPDWKPPDSQWESHPYEQILRVPPGEEQRANDVVAALLDKDYDWQQFDLRTAVSFDESSVARALDSVDAAKSSTVANDADAMRLLRSLAVRVGLDCTPGPRSDTRPKLPNAKCSLVAKGTVLLRAENNRGGRAYKFCSALDYELSKHYEQYWTTEADKRLRAYLERPEYKISRDGGTSKAATSMGAIYLALTGRVGYRDRAPDCMSYTIGRWIIEAGQMMPDTMRDSPAWRELLPRAMHTDPKRDQESLKILVRWVWSTILPTLQPVADKYDINASKYVRPLVRDLRLSYKWKRLLEKQAARSAEIAVSSIDRALDNLGADVLPAMHDDDLFELSRAAEAARNLIAKPTDRAACVESAATAARAAARTGIAWNVIEPIGLLRRMVDASGPSS